MTKMKKQKAKAKVGSRVMHKGVIYTVCARDFDRVNRHSYYVLTNKTFRGCKGYRPIARGDNLTVIG